MELNAPSLENLMGTIQSASPPHVPASILQTTSPNLCACALCDLASLREKKTPRPNSALAPSATLRLCEKKNHPSKLCALVSLQEKKSPFQTLRLRPLRLSVFARKKITLPNSALAPSAP